MENTFIGQAELTQFIDKLAEQKAPGQPITSEEREHAVQVLDERITNAILGDLTVTQLQELDAVLRYNGSESTIENFFNNAGINVKQKVADTMKNFSMEFLGGGNA